MQKIDGLLKSMLESAESLAAGDPTRDALLAAHGCIVELVSTLEEINRRIEDDGK